MKRNELLVKGECEGMRAVSEGENKLLVKVKMTGDRALGGDW